jgi:putative FmdB family regulatory protein
MPIYEYRCAPCNLTFEALIRGQADVPLCPECGNTEVAKQLSVPAAPQAGNHSSSSLPICQTAGSPYACGPGQCRTGLCQFD